MSGQAVATLAGDGVRLRPLAAQDAPLYVALYTDTDLMRAIGPALDAGAARRSFAAALRDARAVEPRRRRWVIVDAATGTDVGLLGLLADGAQAEVGALVRSAHQGRGHAARAIAALASHAFSGPGIERLHTRHAARNTAAAALMRRCGFTRLAADEREVRWELRRTPP